MDTVIKEKQKNKHLNQRFFLILENFINEFTVAKSHPAVAVYTNALEDTRGAYQKLESDIFLQRNHLETLNENLNKRVRLQSKSINKIRERVEILKKEVERLVPIRNSADGLYSEEVEMYRKAHYQIVGFVVGIILASGLTYSTFRKS